MGRADNSYSTELKRLQDIINRCKAFPENKLIAEKGYAINPSLEVVTLAYQGLIELLEGQKSSAEPGEELVGVWKDAGRGEVITRKLTPQDLLVLKIIHEAIPLSAAAAEGRVSVGALEAMLQNKLAEGIILRAPSLLTRDEAAFPIHFADGEFRTAKVFTLQWHITQACDLHCKHCYDRSDRVSMPLDKALQVLDEMDRFCQHHNVDGQVTFTGGNPLMYLHFKELYQAASARGFMVAILGNPTTPGIIDEIQAIQQPEFFQVSLEGLKEHNDEIRGPGHFERVITFLEVLQEKRIYSMVMLTLTQANYQQVLPLAEFLRDKVDLFVFNRLTLFGEGAGLNPVDTAVYEGFLADYQQAARNNPVMAFKDNMFNRLRYESKIALLSGCAGFGCGAAFNFVSLLPDGEVHACRKFPSKLGNIFEASLSDIYQGPIAQKYRRGSSACSDCAIRIACRGCPAVAAGHGLDPFVDLDPYCRGKLS